MGQLQFSVSLSLAFPVLLCLHVTSAFQPCTWHYKVNPDDCGSYYQCSFGIPLLRYCPDGLHWNSEFDNCDWAFRAGCMRVEEEEEEDLNQLDNFPQGPIVGRGSCENVPFRPHPGDCNMYEMCDLGVYKLMYCSSGLHWNPKHNVCDWPENAGCTTGDSSPTPKPTSTTTTSTAKPTTTTEPAGPVPPSTSTTTTAAPTTGPPAPPEGITVGPPAPPSNSGYKVICYFTDWSWYRQDKGKFQPSDIDAKLCTHIVYSFALLDANTWGIRVADTWVDLDNKFYEQVTAFKSSGVKVTLAIGGWNDSAGSKYSEMIRDPVKRAAFIKSAKDFLQEHNFDGLDLDWEYPACPQGNCAEGVSDDRKNFAILVKELRTAMPSAILSAAVSCNMNIIDKGYNVAVLSKYLDWVGVMNYDMHGPWEKKTGHIAPLYYHHDDELDYLNSDYALNHWMSKGADPQKLIFGVPLYGQSFTLVNKAAAGLNAPANGPGKAGEYSKQSGMLAYYEICLGNWTTVVQDEEGGMGPYAVQGDQWVSYDDVDSIQHKIKYIKNEGLGGAMIWALDLDDFKDHCGNGKYPLLTALSNGLRTQTKPTSFFNNGALRY